MKLFSLLCVLGSFFAISAADAAPAKPIKVTDPAAAMKALYAKLEKDDFSTELPLSARLNALMALDSKEAKGEVGRLDGDYFINGQDSKVTNSVVSSREVDNAPGRKIVVVRFKNFEPLLLGENERWLGAGRCSLSRREGRLHAVADGEVRVGWA